MVVDRATVPSVESVLQQAWGISSRSWRTLLSVSVVAWAPFALVASIWVLSTVDPDALAQWVRSPTSDLEVLRYPVAFLAGLPVALALYVLGVSWAAGASALVADDVLRGIPPTARSALRRARSRLHRTVGVYLVLSGLAVLGAVVSLALSLLTAWLTAPWGVVLSAVLAGVVLLGAGAGAGALWLLAYARWSLALPASVLSTTGSLRDSAARTRGRRLPVLLRVATITVAVLLVTSVAGVSLTLLQLGPGIVLLLALTARVLLSVVSGAVTAAGITPLYRALETSME